jgi:integrase
MAGHVEDRWYKSIGDESGKTVRVKTPLHGKGLRYRVRYYDADGRERSKSFPDRHKKAADDFLTEVEARTLPGTFSDPAAGRIPFPQYGAEWLDRQTFDETSRETIERRLRNHIFPNLTDELADIRPKHIRDLDRKMQLAGLAEISRRNALGNVSSILGAAVDDGRIEKNPCKARSAKPPRYRAAKVVPWKSSGVCLVREQLPPRYKVAVDLGSGCGLRQGEILGFAETDIDWAKRKIKVVRQIRIVRGRLVFAEPKGRKIREAPLPASIARRLQAHIKEFPPVSISLPWETPDGPLVSARLILYGKRGVALNRNYFNKDIWWPATNAAGISHERKNGMHALRHYYASVLLDAGESIKALAEYLGHADAGFTLRTYTHLMPSSEDRTRRAIDRALGDRSARPGREGPARARRTAWRRPTRYLWSDTRRSRA